MFSLPRTQVRSLVGELRSCKLCGITKNKKQQEEKSMRLQQSQVQGVEAGKGLTGHEEQMGFIPHARRF